VAAARGKGAVLVFAADWSQESLEALKRLGDPKSKIAATGAEVLGILREADAEKARKVAKDEGIEARIAVDPKRKAYDRFAKSGLPYTVVIDRQGKLASSSAGFDAEAVAKTLEPPKPR
jgi:peroxiredoxin